MKKILVLFLVLFLALQTQCEGEKILHFAGDIGTDDHVIQPPLKIDG